MGYTGEKKREYQRKWIANRRAKWFADKSCEWPECFSIEQLELDHIDPATKIHHSIWSWSWKRIEEETAKCQILCSKHHKLKTSQNKEHARLEYNGRSKLTMPLVAECRIRYRNGATIKGLAREAGVSRNTLRAALRLQTWI